MSFGAQTIESPQRKIGVLALSKTGGATPLLEGLCASFCTVVDLGVGQYEITVNVQRPFENGLHVALTPHTSAILTKYVVASDNLKVTVYAYDVDGTTPVDVDFDILIVGSFARDLIGI